MEARKLFPSETFSNKFPLLITSKKNSSAKHHDNTQSTLMTFDVILRAGGSCTQSNVILNLNIMQIKSF